MSTATHRGESTRILAGCERKSRTHAEREPRAASRFPAPPSRASLPEPVTAESLGVRERCHTVRQLATDDVMPMLVRTVGHDKAYGRTRSDGTKDKFRALCEDIIDERNAGMSEAKARLYEVELVALLADLYQTATPPMHDVKALEVRYECQSQIVWADIQRRIASGEPESPAMWNEYARAEAMDIAHDIALFRFAQRRSRELRKAAQTTPTLKVER